MPGGTPQLGVVVQHLLKVGCTIQYTWLPADGAACAGMCEPKLKGRFQQFLSITQQAASEPTGYCHPSDGGDDAGQSVLFHGLIPLFDTERSGKYNTRDR